MYKSRAVKPPKKQFGSWSKNVLFVIVETQYWMDLLETATSSTHKKNMYKNNIRECLIPNFSYTIILGGLTFSLQNQWNKK